MHNILYYHQCGFQSKHSAQQAIIELVDKITSAIEQDEYTFGKAASFWFCQKLSTQLIMKSS